MNKKVGARRWSLTSARWIFLSLVVVSLAGLATAQHYFGGIYRGWDAQFYYGLARSIVFDHDLDLTNDLETTVSPRPFDADGDGILEAIPRGPKGSAASKYPIGLSLIEAPFLLVGQLVRASLGTLTSIDAPPGYSGIEFWCTAVGLIVLTCLASTVLWSLLKERFGIGAATIGVFACWLSTSLFYYASVFPFMAHATSFAALDCVLWIFSRLDAQGVTNARLAALGLFTALLFLVRPQQILVLAFMAPYLLLHVRRSQTSSWFSGAAIGFLLGIAA